jgi:hypothetical protein
MLFLLTKLSLLLLHGRAIGDGRSPSFASSWSKSKRTYHYISFHVHSMYYGMGDRTIDIIIIIGAPLIPDMPIDFVLLELLQHSQQKTRR